MDQIGSDSDENEEQPLPKGASDKARICSIGVQQDALGNNPDLPAAWYIMKFMEATKYGGEWITEVSVRPSTYYTEEQVLKFWRYTVREKEREGIHSRDTDPRPTGGSTSLQDAATSTSSKPEGVQYCSNTGFHHEQSRPHYHQQ